jgi:hypothetical protein
MIYCVSVLFGIFQKIEIKFPQPNFLNKNNLTEVVFVKKIKLLLDCFSVKVTIQRIVKKYQFYNSRSIAENKEVSKYSRIANFLAATGLHS